mmetsp:Transcript_104772/g.165411  ORF Transcript_104772/g.165411 Transcript_104772/m.165411 type:complete len:201 (-) Transcript_104772:156-758(-)
MSDDGIHEFTAGPEIEKLGLAFSALPPSPIVIKRVNVDTWADEEGIQAGDVLVALNGVDVGGMTQDEFKAAMQVRPLSVRIAEVWQEEKAEHKGEELQQPSRRATVYDTDQALASKTECRVEEAADNGQSERKNEQPVFTGQSSGTPPLQGISPPNETGSNAETAADGKISSAQLPKRECQAARQRRIMFFLPCLCCGQS